MPRRGFDQIPSPPTRRRRGGILKDPYELGFLALWLASGTAATLLFFVSSNTGWGGTNYTMENNKNIIYLLYGFFAVFGLGLLRFDYLSKNREETNFEVKMNEYTKLREVWLENQEELMKLQQENIRHSQKIIVSESKMESESDSVTEDNSDEE
jgi:hypothetical protein